MKKRNASNNEHEMQIVEQELQSPDALFHAIHTAAHEEILRLLREHEEDTVAFVALGPLTNIALAMAKDATTFSRVKELVIMGGSLAATDNSDVAVLDNCGMRTMAPDIRSICSPVQASSVSIEPPFRLTTQPQGPIRDALNLRNRVSSKAEYNTFADPLAAAYICNSTTCSMVATRVREDQGAANQDDYHHSEQPGITDLTLFTHDVTISHVFTQDVIQEIARPLVSIGSPLAMWLRDTLTPSLEKPHRAGSLASTTLCASCTVLRAMRRFMVDPVGRSLLIRISRSLLRANGQREPLSSLIKASRLLSATI
jgi:hypothetical protein